MLLCRVINVSLRSAPGKRSLHRSAYDLSWRLYRPGVAIAYLKGSDVRRREGLLLPDRASLQVFPQVLPVQDFEEHNSTFQHNFHYAEGRGRKIRAANGAEGFQ